MNSAAYEKKIAANVHHWIAMAFTQERHEACHSTVHRGICNSHFDNGVCNGASLILKLDKILLIVRGVTIAYWKHWSNAAKGTQGFFFNPFCSRGWEIYKPRKLKIVASILINVVMGIFPFRNGHWIQKINNFSWL